ncbi:hypothetical protein [Flavobacterium sp. 5]|uniref:hypothetical protein n=1 Tax=Flavobacterium sp. 5 TaxID=2035199 RepID=UPI000C2BACD5|nr:hypothetical protein [Flavobacterium sp. 5]PKB18230.1 hypothetical protein CLU82_3495 [Flavobacterium sp. 5]
MEEKRRKNKILIRKVIKIVFVLVLIFLVQHFYVKNKMIGDEITPMITNYNRACPMMISDDIRMESVNSLPENTVQYDFTLVRVQKENIDVKVLKTSVEKEILSTSKTNPSLEAFRNNNSTVVYVYRDTNQKMLFKVVLTPELYQ